MEVVYQDFSLWIEALDAGSLVRIQARSPAGEAWEEVQLPGLAEPQESRCAPGATPPVTGVPPAAVAPQRDLAVEAAVRAPDHDARCRGDALFRAVFSGRVGRLFASSCGTLPDPRRGLRIKLHFDPTKPFAAAPCSLPWELLYDAATKDYLGINPLTPVVRYIEVPRAGEVAPFQPPLHILLMASNPATSTPLDLQRERRLIEQAWAQDPEVLVRVLERSDRERLQDEVSGVAFDVLHFMGHAGFDDASGAGALLLEGPLGQSEPMPGEVLANLLKGRLPRLVVLNACSSARALSGAGRDFFAGLAAALVMGGVPAVVAMRSPISDLAAIRFSRVLYRQLARGQAVDAAVAEGRRALYGEAPGSPEWATPVLFMRVPDGRLFMGGRDHGDGASRGAGHGVADGVFIKARNVELKNSAIANQIGLSVDAASPGSIQIDSDTFRAEGSSIANKQTSS
jgi:hypothetical protein